jgi:hypothetical protein
VNLAVVACRMSGPSLGYQDASSNFLSNSLSALSIGRPGKEEEEQFDLRKLSMQKVPSRKLTIQQGTMLPTSLHDSSASAEFSKPFGLNLLGVQLQMLIRVHTIQSDMASSS